MAVCGSHDYSSALTPPSADDSRPGEHVSRASMTDVPMSPERVGYHVRRPCEAAGVPVVCPHGLRGTHSSISVREVSIEHVAAALGHSSPAVTRRHYLARGAEQAGRQRAVLGVIDGGKR